METRERIEKAMKIVEIITPCGDDTKIWEIRALLELAASIALPGMGPRLVLRGE